MGDVLALPVGHALGRLHDGGGIAAQHHRPPGEIGKSAGKVGIDLPQIAVGGGEGPLILQHGGVGEEIFPQLRAGALSPGQLAQPGRQGGAPPFGQLGQSLPHREDVGPVDGLAPPLGEGVKDPQGIHLVPEKLRSHRGALPRGEDIQDPAPKSELPSPLHLVTAGIARQHQLLRQGFHVIAAAVFHAKGRPGQGLRGEGALHESVRRGAQHPDLSGEDGVQRPQAQLLIFPGDALHIVKNHVPGRENGGFLPRDGQKIRGKAPGRLFVPENGAEAALRETVIECRRQMGPMDRGQAINRAARAALGPGQHLCIFRQTAGKLPHRRRDPCLLHGSHPP